MAQRVKPCQDGDRRAVSFTCPGCGDKHVMPVEGASPTWGFNGNMERPTLTPSIFVRCGHYVPGFEDKRACWCSYNEEHPTEPAPFRCYACHSFVTDGRIQFLGDCSHVLAGQTVDLPDIV